MQGEKKRFDISRPWEGHALGEYSGAAFRGTCASTVDHVGHLACTSVDVTSWLVTLFGNGLTHVPRQGVCEPYDSGSRVI